MNKVFISYAEEDGDLAAQIADALEQGGYDSWYYQRDAIAGNYLAEITAAIDRCSVFVIVISEHSIDSHQVDCELVHAFEEKKKLLPVLRGITHDEFRRRQPVWRQALGAAIGIPVNTDSVHATLERITAGVARMLGSTLIGHQSTKDPHVLSADIEASGHARELEMPGLKGDQQLARRPDPLPCIRRLEFEPLAYSIVRRGVDSMLKDLPVARFGFLVTADPTEIDSYRTLADLIDDYLKSARTRHPLCIGVFGPPGTGKQFGISQVARSIAGDGIANLTIDIGQYRSVDELAKGFRQIQEIGLEGRTPLVFFDEFDADFDGELGWLTHLLPPMHEGRFADGDGSHPIGKAIFAFVSGKSPSFDAFCRDTADRNTMATFIQRRGPEFVSGLRGYVDVVGPNPVSDDDNFAMIRRAITLRLLIERTRPELLDEKRNAHIEECVLRALIKVPMYKHATRSMEAILNMSSLADRGSFDRTALPSMRQLNMHVDARMFMLLVDQDALFGAAREKLGRAFHEHYIKTVTGRPVTHPSVQPWDSLREDIKEVNRLQADDIPAKLRQIRCWLMPMPGGDSGRKFLFSADEVEVLAEREHERWLADKVKNGWGYGPARDDETKTHPCLTNWTSLPDEEKEKDRDSVRIIPEILAEAGFEIYRLP